MHSYPELLQIDKQKCDLSTSSSFLKSSPIEGEEENSTTVVLATVELTTAGEVTELVVTVEAGVVATTNCA